MTAPFHASAWVDQFSEAGGAYALTDGHLHLWPAPGTGNHGNRAETYAMVSSLSAADRQKLAEHLRSAPMVEG